VEVCCKEAVIIAVSGYGKEQVRSHSGETGFDHHLVKPVNFETLLAVIDRANAGPLN
jgi:DNA-binding response OmpR family regulator